MDELVHIVLGALALLLAFLAGRRAARPFCSICQLDKLTTGPAKNESPDPSQSLPFLRDDEESRATYHAISISRGLVQPESRSTSGRNSRDQK